MKYEICGKAIIDEKDIERILSFGFSRVEIKLKREDLFEKCEYTKNFLLKHVKSICSLHIYHAELYDFPNEIYKLIDIYNTIFNEKRPILVLHSNRILSIMLLEYHNKLLDMLFDNDIPFCLESQPGESLEFLENFILPRFDFCLDIAHFWISSPNRYIECLKALLSNWSKKIKLVHINSVKIENNIPMDNQPLSNSLNPPMEDTLKLFRDYLSSDVPLVVEVPPEQQKKSKEILLSLLNKI